MAKKSENYDEKILDMIDFDCLGGCMQQLEPRDYVNATLRLMDFVIPKKQAVAQDPNSKLKDEFTKRLENMLGISKNE